MGIGSNIKHQIGTAYIQGKNLKSDLEQKYKQIKEIANQMIKMWIKMINKPL